MKLHTLVISSAGLAICSIACASLFGFGSDSWKEEVLLHDGSKLIVKRSQNYGGKREIGQSAPIREHAIAFTLPNTKQVITWASEYWKEFGTTNFHLLAVHVLDGTPYIVAYPAQYYSYNKWGRPNPPYVFFKFNSNEWQRITLKEFPAEFKTINVAIAITGRSLDELVRQGLVSSERIKMLNRDTGLPELKTILREEIRPSAHGSAIDWPIPTTAAGKLIAPEIDGKPLYYNWWPLAQDWLNKTYRREK